MKRILSEQNKHRIIGVLVILSVLMLIMPAVMKKSTQRFEENLSVSLKLPARPMLPKVAVPSSKTMFKSVKVAKVDIPKAPSVPATSLIAKAEPLNKQTALLQKSMIASVNHQFKTVANKPVQTAQRETNAKKIALAANARSIFSVQVATFVQQSNASHLVDQFKRQGFAATYHKINNEKGEFYRVVVGQLSEREQALSLQKKIASNMQLNGFVVKVS